jgi:hypothetical protein
MKLVYYLSAGLMAIPIASCLPVAGANVKRVLEKETPSVFEYGTYKKREAEEDTPMPSIFGYKKREAEEDTPTPSVFEYGTYKKREAEE